MAPHPLGHPSSPLPTRHASRAHGPPLPPRRDTRPRTAPLPAARENAVVSTAAVDRCLRMRPSPVPAHGDAVLNGSERPRVPIERRARAVPQRAVADLDLVRQVEDALAAEHESFAGGALGLRREEFGASLDAGRIKDGVEEHREQVAERLRAEPGLEQGERSLGITLREGAGTAQRIERPNGRTLRSTPQRQSVDPAEQGRFRLLAGEASRRLGQLEVTLHQLGRAALVRAQPADERLDRRAARVFGDASFERVSELGELFGELGSRGAGWTPRAALAPSSPSARKFWAAVALAPPSAARGAPDAATHGRALRRARPRHAR
jgi:hypothetical protein